MTDPLTTAIAAGATIGCLAYAAVGYGVAFARRLRHHDSHARALVALEEMWRDER